MKWFWYGQEKGLPCMNDKLKTRKKPRQNSFEMKQKWTEKKKTEKLKWRCQQIIEQLSRSDFVGIFSDYTRTLVFFFLSLKI